MAVQHIVLVEWKDDADPAAIDGFVSAVRAFPGIIDGVEKVEFGETLQLNAVVRPTLFEPTATIVSITADLSGLGGPDAVPLEDLGDGTYRLSAEFTVGGEAQIRDVEVFIEQPVWNAELLGQPHRAQGGGNDFLNEVA